MPRNCGGLSFVIFPVISSFPRLKINARIDNCVHQIADQIHQQTQQGEEIKGGKHHRVVALERCLESEQTQPVREKMISISKDPVNSMLTNAPGNPAITISIAFRKYARKERAAPPDLWRARSVHTVD